VSLDAYKRNMAAYGITGESSDRLLNRFIDDLKNSFLDNFSYYEVVVNSVDKNVHIVSDSSIDSNPNKKIMLSYPGDEYAKGDYVVWGSTNWLIYDIDDNKKVQNRCELYRCNGTLKGIDTNGKINEYQCIVSYSNTSSSGIDNNNYLDTLDNVNEIIVQNNTYTDSIVIGDRFIFGGNVYKCGRNITYYKDNIIIFYMDFDEKSDNDNFDLGLADYYNRSIFEINIPEGDIELSTAISSRFNAVVTENGVVVSKDILWESSNELIATVDEDGLVTTILDGSCFIKATMTDNEDVYTDINLTVTSTISDNFEIVVNPNDETIRLDDTISFNVKLLNNSVDTGDGFTFTVFGGSVGSEDYSFNVIDGNNFTLTNNKEDKDIIIRMVSGIHALDKTIEFKWLY